MHALSLVLTSLLALTVSALPLNTTTTEDGFIDDSVTALEARAPKHHKHHKHGKHTFKLHVVNKCPFEKEFAIYTANEDFQMEQKSHAVTIQPGKSHNFHPHFHAKSMRLSGHAEWVTAGQWQAQALFEFGYSSYAGKKGTAYDASIMPGSDVDIGIGIFPFNKKCETKVCWPDNCDPSQGWTNPDQSDLGSPADTVCYHGKTGFKVVFCP